jgi:hypothetical protein
VAEGSGTIFDHIDLSPREWVDYDEKQHVPVAIYGAVFDFVKP